MINIRNYLRTIYDYASLTRAFTVIENTFKEVTDDVETLQTDVTTLQDGKLWTSYTPTLTNASVGTGTNSALYRVDGDTLYLNGRLSFNSGSVTGTVAISLPSGLSRANSAVINIGSAVILDTSVAWGDGSLHMLADTEFRIVLQKSGSTAINIWSNSHIGTGTSTTLQVYYSAVVPLA